jgi:hypothetical protein
MILEDSPNPKDSPVFIRGEAENKGEIVYQREPRPEEIRLGVDFVLQSPDYETVPRMAGDGNGRARRRPANPVKARRLQASFASIPAGERKPLTPWEKYAHALLQANEAMFVN